MPISKGKRALVVVLAAPFVFIALAVLGIRLWMAFLEVGWVRQERYNALKQEQYEPRLRAAMIAAGKIEIGMTSEECRSARGTPTRVNRTTTAHIVFEQWCYGESCSPALYFQNGILTSFQDEP